MNNLSNYIKLQILKFVLIESRGDKEKREEHYSWLIDLFSVSGRFTTKLDRKFFKTEELQKSQWVAVKPWDMVKDLFNKDDIVILQKKVRFGKGNVSLYTCKNTLRKYVVKKIEVSEEGLLVNFKNNMNEMMNSSHMNLLRPYCPNFVYTHYVTVDEVRKGTDQFYYLLMEHLKLEFDDRINELNLSKDDKLKMRFFKTFFIQLLFAKLCGNLIKFTHQDLFIGNLMLEDLRDSEKPVTLTLRFNDPNSDKDVFQIPNCEFILKIIDFGLSKIEFPTKSNFENLKMSRVTRKVVNRIFNVVRKAGENFKKNIDMMTITNDLRDNVFKAFFKKDGNLLKTIVNFTNRVLKEVEYGPIKNESIFKLLGHSFFDEFRIKKKDSKHKVNPNYDFSYKKVDVYENIPLDMGFLTIEQLCESKKI